jgi:hypothetical protein
MATIPVSEAEVGSIMRALKSKGTAGYDGITSKILKLCTPASDKMGQKYLTLYIKTGVNVGYLAVY